MKKIFVATIAVILALLCFALPINAIDGDYYDFRRDTTGDIKFGGNWNQFWSITGHTFTHSISYANEFANSIGESAGHQEARLKIELNDDMSSGGEKWVTFGLYPDAETPRLGGYMVLRTDSINDYIAQVKCYNNWGTKIGDTLSINFQDYYFAIFCQWAFEADSDSRYMIQDIVFEKFSKSSMERTVLCTWGEWGGSFVDSDCEFVHFVDADYGYTSPNAGTWKATFYLNEIGINPDIAYCDLEVTMLDVVAVTGQYGKTLVADGFDYWMSSSCWKADINQDYKIDIFDVTYICAKYGSSW